jgi:hypothetical protein
MTRKVIELGWLMRDLNANLPPRELLEALRQPRRTQLHDTSVRVLLSRWKRLGRAITLAELSHLLDLVAPGVDVFDVDHVCSIIAAVEAAGIRLLYKDEAAIPQVAHDTAEEADLPAALARVFGRPPTSNEIRSAEWWHLEFHGLR